ncbi:DHA2 family multidrug resistance protein [Hydrogenispora ethanolica]|uniref:DHA2 family multidrug resistance protein n=1 Tax=Hydrogenispora ethanolica TaxID=1082276 RepID=A0A4R1RU77_HYDET|nr:DHA2 family efflux MFS transporter permease subunit [Hydrogenispora ethanolica]TCL70118.1 DHA2 family multidrug resistance protein [Hydrogenispora ethanolica]
MAVHHLLQRKLISRFASLHPEHESYRWWVLANIMVGTFMAVLDATIVNVGLPKIMAAFGASLDKIEWISTAYMLVFAVMLPTSGWLADHFGYKRSYFTALLLFTAGSLLCSLAWNENSLIFFRVIQGAGGGLMMPVGMAIVTREFPPEQRGMALGFWGIAAAASISLGPLIGGYLVDNLSWQSIFSVNVPVGLFGMLATLVIQREYRTETSRSFDLVGFLSMAFFLTFLLIALSDGNASWNIGGWTSPFILGCFAVSLVGLVIFLYTEFTVAHPLIELRLLKNFNYGISCLVLFIFGLGMFGSTFIQPMYLQNSLGYTALQAGAVFLPVGIIQGLISPIAGSLADKINPKVPTILGIILMAASLYLNSFLSLFSEREQIMIPLYLRGLGMGILFTPLSTLALSQIPREKMAQASGIFNVIRQVGGSFGVAMLGTILTQRQIFHTAIAGQAVRLESPVFKNTLNAVISFAKAMAGGPAYHTAIRAYNDTLRAEVLIISHLSKQAFVQAVNDCYLVTAVVTTIGIIPILFLKVNKKKTAGHGAPPSVE